MRLLVTGGCGFIGSNFIRLILDARADWIVHNVDKLTYAGNPENLAGFVEPFGSRYIFHQADIADPNGMERVFAETRFDAVVNFAAESHVDRSITGPLAFIHTNVMGTGVLLDLSRKHKIQRFLQI